MANERLELEDIERIFEICGIGQKVQSHGPQILLGLSDWMAARILLNIRVQSSFEVAMALFTRLANSDHRDERQFAQAILLCIQPLDLEFYYALMGAIV